MYFAYPLIRMTSFIDYIYSLSNEVWFKEVGDIGLFITVVPKVLY